MTPFYGTVVLENGLVLGWLRFARDEAEAKRLVVAQHVHVVACWTVDLEGD